MKWMSRHRVATWLGAGQEKRCRDPVLRSRPGDARVVSRHRFDVATCFLLP